MANISNELDSIKNASSVDGLKVAIFDALETISEISKDRDSELDSLKKTIQAISDEVNDLIKNSTPYDIDNLRDTLKAISLELSRKADSVDLVDTTDTLQTRSLPGGAILRSGDSPATQSDITQLRADLISGLNTRATQYNFDYIVGNGFQGWTITDYIIRIREDYNQMVSAKASKAEAEAIANQGLQEARTAMLGHLETLTNALTHNRSGTLEHYPWAYYRYDTDGLTTVDFRNMPQNTFIYCKYSVVKDAFITANIPAVDWADANNVAIFKRAYTRFSRYTQPSVITIYNVSKVQKLEMLYVGDSSDAYRWFFQSERYLQNFSKNFESIDTAWEAGTIAIPSGELFSSAIYLRTGLAPIPSSGKIYVKMIPGYVVRLVAYKIVNGQAVPAYSDGLDTMVDEITNKQYELTYYTDIVFTPDTTLATHFRLRLNKMDKSNIYVSDVAGKITFSSDYIYVNDPNKAELVEEADRVSRLVNSTEGFKFIGVSDIHYWHNTDTVKTSITDMSNAVKQIAKYSDIDYMMSFGDYIYRWLYEYKYEAGRCEIIAANNFLSCFDGYPQIRLTGNHDTNALELDGNGNFAGYFSMQDLYDRIGRYNTTLTVDPLNPIGNYGVVDIADKKIRIIALNTSDFTDEGHPPISPREDNAYINSSTTYQMSIQQLRWFANALALDDISDPTNWTILVISHIPIDTIAGDFYDALGTNPGLLLDHFVNKRSGSMTFKTGTSNSAIISYDYRTAPTPDGILVIAGHNHTYKVNNIYLNRSDDDPPVYTYGSIVRVQVPNAVPYRTVDAMKSFRDASNTAFCAFVLNTASHMLYSYHYGAGWDRYVHYKPIALSGSTMILSSIFDNPTWAASNASVATVDSGGIVAKVATGNVVISATNSNGDVEYWSILCS